MFSRCALTVFSRLASDTGVMEFNFRPASEGCMPTKAFVIAMAADIARSDYAKPTLIRCRWGPDGEYLSIATAGAIQDPLGLRVPAGISPIHSLVGVLVAESEAE